MPSFRIVAVTPASAALIASRTAARLFRPSAITISLAGLSTFGVNVSPSYLPKEIVNVPVPTVSVVAVNVVDLSFCAWASV